MNTKITFALACICLWLLPLYAQAATNIPHDKSAAVVLAYQRVGEDTYPATNLRREQFNSHIKALVNEGYNVVSLHTILDAYNNKTPLPARTVAITFEGGYKSALKNAIPLLIENNLPFTVFFSSAHADKKLNQYLSWNDLRKLQQNPRVDIGLQSAQYERIYRWPHADMLHDINVARTRYRKELKAEPSFFSYPYGEYSLALKNMVKEQGFKAAFGMHSGALYAQSDRWALPRFSMTHSYASLSRFRMVANALPLPIHDIEPEDPFLLTKTPAIGFSIDPTLSQHINQLSCFITGQSQPEIEVLGQTRIELKLIEPLQSERVRVNCTMPGVKSAGRTSWRWFGMLLNE